MKTLHLYNHRIKTLGLHQPFVAIAITILVAAVIWFSTQWQQFIVGILLIIAAFFSLKHFIKQSTVGYTLTATHFQQHFAKGGWVVHWKNISKLGICQCHTDGWYQPLPWIGIKLKDYAPYLDSICPRITTELLLSQRALLYLGLKQSGQINYFEDKVLDSRPYQLEDGTTYTGLQAMLANRMANQRALYDYDVFIAVSDLDRSGEEFVGLMRRYLAAADKEKGHNRDLSETIY
ncbi:DUF2982 domain-containing protein [Vibrio taketomensis]|uniref:DUF2982 domain-containing protein n=1 Tax=Vibrio taketomensis TaxID=2572923 RepID=UPI001389BD12|nr:DUF2982 domain-containing protein [Vibrio taketomensis]